MIRLNYVSCTVKLSHIACGAKRLYIGEVKNNNTVNFLICLGRNRKLGVQYQASIRPFQTR